MYKVKCDIAGCKAEEVVQHQQSMPKGWGTVNWTKEIAGSKNYEGTEQMLSALKAMKSTFVKEYAEGIEKALGAKVPVTVAFSAVLCSTHVESLELASVSMPYGGPEDY